MKKKINILLIIVVASLWGTAGYRYIKSFLSKQDIEISASQGRVTNLDEFYIKRDTFSLAVLSHDPFFNKLITTKKTVVPRQNINRVAQKRVLTQWPAIEYFGYIKSQGNKELVIIKINNKLVRLHLYEEKDNIKISKIYNDSIQVIYGKEKRFFKNMLR